MNLKIFLNTLLLFGFLSVSAQKTEPITGQYIVILKESVARPVIKQQRMIMDRFQKVRENKEYRDKNLSKLKEIRQRMNIKESDVLNDFADVLVGFSANLSSQQVMDLKSDATVEGVYQDFRIVSPILTKKPFSREILLSTQVEDSAVTMAGGWVDGSSKQTRIWILDTGMDLTHPDLNIETNPTLAKSFINGEALNDGTWHATHVAGIAAAKNNSFGVVGVSAGAKVIPVKIINQLGIGNILWTMQGLDHVAQYDIPGDVVCLATLFGSSEWLDPDLCEKYYSPVVNAIKNLGLAGTWVVMNAGDNYKDAACYFPSCLNGTKIVTVGSIDRNNSWMPSSNYNPNVVDWVAMGSNVNSTFRNNSYCTASGTCVAAAVVAGIIHARGDAPQSCGTVTYKGATYRIAHR